MKPHRIERAIIVAAGKGERLLPVTAHTPKPLVKVNGKRMIDTIVDALHQNGIFEIYVVVGYKKEQFYDWASEHEGVCIIENPWFEQYNNISSLYTARAHTENSVIIEGDLVIANPDIFVREFDRSGYSSIRREEVIGEWFFTMENGVLTNCSKNGGKNGWQLYGISRWTAADGKKLRAMLEIEFGEKKRNGFWDEIPLFYYPEAYELTNYAMSDGDVVEIDSFEELCVIDKTYREEE